MEEVKERYFNINGKDYALSLITKKKDDNKQKVEGIVREMNSKRPRGKFIESWVSDAEATYYALNILLNEKPQKQIRIREAYCEGGFYVRFEQFAFEKNPGIFSGWKEIPLKETPISYSTHN